MADLDKERIAAAALALVDEHGLKGFSMRAVARALGVTPMALYHHVGSKEELAVLVVNAANVVIPRFNPTGDWREGMWRMAKAVRGLMLAHPRVAELRRAYRIWSPEVLEETEHWMNLWQQSGLKQDDAIKAAAVSSLAIVALIEDESVRDDDLVGDQELDPTKPDARTLLEFRMERSAMFELAVRSLIDGLHRRLMGNSDQACPGKVLESRKNL